MASIVATSFMLPVNLAYGQVALAQAAHSMAKI